jgi:DNA-directed RNA polymerase III subunit RPC1
VTQVLDLFRRISDEDCELLWMNANVGRPENLIIQNLLVPPVPIRPSVAMDIGGGSTEVCVLARLSTIVLIVSRIGVLMCRLLRSTEYTAQHHQ